MAHQVSLQMHDFLFWILVSQKGIELIKEKLSFNFLSLKNNFDAFPIVNYYQNGSENYSGNKIKNNITNACGLFRFIRKVKYSTAQEQPT